MVLGQLVSFQCMLFGLTTRQGINPVLGLHDTQRHRLPSFLGQRTTEPVFETQRSEILPGEQDEVWVEEPHLFSSAYLNRMALSHLTSAALLDTRHHNYRSYLDAILNVYSTYHYPLKRLTFQTVLDLR